MGHVPSLFLSFFLFFALSLSHKHSTASYLLDKQFGDMWGMGFPSPSLSPSPCLSLSLSLSSSLSHARTHTQTLSLTHTQGTASYLFDKQLGDTWGTGIVPDFLRTILVVVVVLAALVWMLWSACYFVDFEELGLVLSRFA